MDAEVQQSEKELEALQNTLMLLRGSNHAFEQHFIEQDAEAVLLKEDLTEKLKGLRSNARERREKSLQLEKKLRVSKAA